MKKVSALLLAFVLIFSLAGCSSEGSVNIVNNDGNETNSKFSFLENTESETSPESDDKQEDEATQGSDSDSADPSPDTNNDNNGHNTVYITDSGKKYHRSGCRHISKSKIPISEEEAIQQGYTPCKVCKP